MVQLSVSYVFAVNRLVKKSGTAIINLRFQILVWLLPSRSLFAAAEILEPKVSTEKTAFRKRENYWHAQTAVSMIKRVIRTSLSRL